MSVFKIKDTKDVLIKGNGEVIEVDNLNNFVKTEVKEEPEIEENECGWNNVFEKYNLDNLEYDDSREPVQTADTEIIYDGTLYFLDMTTLELLKQISKLYSDKKVIITEIKHESEDNVETDKPFRMMKTKTIISYDIE